MERCNSQFAPVAFKCERIKGHDGCHATREAFETNRGGYASMSPAFAATLDWYREPTVAEQFAERWRGPFGPGGFNAAESQQPPARNTAQPAVTDLVLADFQARDAFGAKKYGTRLQPHNGRDAMLDAYQEVLDLACYLRQLIYERDGK